MNYTFVNLKTMDKIIELRQIVDNIERSYTVTINSQNDYNSRILGNMPKYMIFNCDEIFIELRPNHVHEYINNWDFSACKKVIIHGLNNVIIKNTTLKNASIELRNCEHIVVDEYNVSSIFRICNCSIHSKTDISDISWCYKSDVISHQIGDVEHAMSCNIFALSIYQIIRCTHSTFNANDVIVLPKCYMNNYSTINVGSTQHHTISHNMLDNCEFCKFVFTMPHTLTYDDIDKKCQCCKIICKYETDGEIIHYIKT